MWDVCLLDENIKNGFINTENGKNIRISSCNYVFMLEKKWSFYISQQVLEKNI